MKRNPLAILSASPDPDDDSFDQSEVASQQKKKLCGFSGAGLLVIGVFMPIVSMPIVGSLNYLHNGRGDGVIILALGILSGLLVLGNRYRGLLYTGILSLAIMCFTLCHFLAMMNIMREGMAKSDNIFKGIGEAILSTVQIQWGWLPLVAGGFLVLAAGVLEEELVDSEGRGIPVSQRKAWRFLGICGAALTLAIVAAPWLLPDFLGQLKVPSLKSEARRGNTKDASSLNLGSGGRATEVSTPGTTSPGGWQYAERASEMDGKKTAILSLSADEKIAGLITAVTPGLAIRCDEGTLDVVVNTGNMVDVDIWSSTSKVRVRMDDTPPVAQRWTPSTDRESLFARNPSQLIRQLLGARTFLFEFEPYNKGPQVVRFNVTELNLHIGKIASACPKARL